PPVEFVFRHPLERFPDPCHLEIKLRQQRLRYCHIPPSFIPCSPGLAASDFDGRAGTAFGDRATAAAGATSAAEDAACFRNLRRSSPDFFSSGSPGEIAILNNSTSTKGSTNQPPRP